MKFEITGELTPIPSSSSYTLNGILLLIGDSSPSLSQYPHSYTHPYGEVPVQPRAKSRVKAVQATLPGFDEWYAAYPRKAQRKDAEDAYKHLLRLNVDPADLMRAVCAYAKECARERREPKFIKHPATFLRNERWRDYIPDSSELKISPEEMDSIKQKYVAGEYTEAIVRKIEAKYGVSIIP
jgi:hypothetical protein